MQQAAKLEHKQRYFWFQKPFLERYIKISEDREGVINGRKQRDDHLNRSIVSLSHRR